jgi:hypothetical protein
VFVDPEGFDEQVNLPEKVEGVYKFEADIKESAEKYSD